MLYCSIKLPGPIPHTCSMHSLLRLVHSIWSKCQSEETITRRLQTEINSVHEKILPTQLKLHSVCSTGTWDPQMHNSWRRLPKLFDLPSFSHNLYPLTIPLDCKSCFVVYIYINIYIPMNVQKLNHDNINKYWTMPQSCSTLLGICHAETSRAGTPGSVNWKYSRACGPFEVMAHPQTSHVCTYMTDVAAQEGKNIRITRWHRLKASPSVLCEDHIVDIHVCLYVLPPTSRLIEHNDSVNTSWHFEQCARITQPGKDLGVYFPLTETWRT